MSISVRNYRAVLEGRKEPWEVERLWQNGTISPSRSGALFGAIFGILWLALVSGLVAAFVVAFDDPILALFALVFVAPGVYMLFRFVPRVLHERQYRGVHLKPSRIPVQPGERIEAVLYSGADAQRHATADVQFDVRLTCNKLIERSGTSDHGRRYTRKILWEQNLSVAASVGASMGGAQSGSVLTAHIADDLPSEMPETTRNPTERDKIDWRLEVDGRPGLPGFQVSFMLPIYDTRSARERADESLGAVSAVDHTASLDAPVPKGDLGALGSYRDSVWESRIEKDERLLVKRLTRATEPHTHLTRHEDLALSCIHVRGDRPARWLRRGVALLLIVLVFAVPGLPTIALFLGAVVLAIMAKAARPVAIAVHADSEGVQVDSVDGRKRRSSQYSWDQIGMVTDVAFSNRYRDIMLPRPNRGRNTLGVRISSKQYAEGLASAIAAVRNRYRTG